MEPDALERLGVVGGDLDFLIRLPSDRLPTVTEGRFVSVILRRLLVEGLLARVWGDLRFDRRELTIQAPGLDGALDRVAEHHVVYAFAGGLEAQGSASHSGFVLMNIPAEEWRSFGSPEAAIAALYPEYPEPEVVDMKVPRLLTSSCLAIGGQTGAFGPVLRVSRHDTIVYVANKAGGVHVDPRRPELTSASTAKELAPHVLDVDLIRVGGLPGPVYEVCATGKAVAASPAAHRIVKVARERVPEMFGGDPTELRFWSPEGKWETMRFGPAPP